MPGTGTGGASGVTPGVITADLPLVAGHPTHITSVKVGVAGTYLVVGMLTVSGTTANMWLGSVAGSDTGVYTTANSSKVAGVAALLKLAANSVVHLNCQAAGTGKAVARPGQSQHSASQTSVGAVLVST